MRNSKRFVNLVSLVVLVATNVISPLTYATAGEEDIGSVSDTVSYGAEGGSESESYDDSGDSIDDSDMEEDSSAESSDSEQISPDSSLSREEEDFQGEEEDSASSLLDKGDMALAEGIGDETEADSSAESSDSEQISPDPSLSRGEEYPQNDEIHEGEDEGVWIIDTIKTFMPDDIRLLDEVFEEDNSEIVESEEIYGTGEYEGVEVEVYAQTGAFPLGTILNIIPITGDDEMGDIQDVLEQQKNVEKSQKVIAFDITFLDSETEEELQPLMTGAVQVTFNYEENDELVAAEENEEQEVKVYHLNDKDEEGEKIESITGTVVEDVVVNEEASEEVDNAVVIDAESFSVYTIVVQRNAESNGTRGWQYGTDYFTIDIARPSTLSSTYYPIEGFTIMDRNLGATTTGTTCGSTNTGACGYHYQWGYNYGFDPSLDKDTIKTSNFATRNTSYNHNGYDGSDVNKKFILGTSKSKYDIWSDNTPANHNGLWGGENDQSNNWGLGLSNSTDRQGPCPEGWHVPSIGEWSLLIKYWGIANRNKYPDGIDGLNGSLVSASSCEQIWCYDDSGTYGPGCDETHIHEDCMIYARLGDDFANYFKLPFAGSRNYSDASIGGGQGSYGYYWSSSPDSAGSNYARILDLHPSYVSADNLNNRALGNSVRCFRDEYGTPTAYKVTFNPNNGEEITTQYVEDGQIAIAPSPAPTRTKGTFAGWYTNKELTQTFNFSTPITEDITLYAKWNCNAGYATLSGDDGSRNCFEYNTISITGYNGKQYVLMDRNLGAKVAWNGTDYSDNSANYDSDSDYYGYYYQWGNNWGFSAKTTTAGLNSEITVSTYKPSAYYNSKWNSHQPWSTQDYLWGEANNTEVARRGPCPEGWHVPSFDDWHNIVGGWQNLPSSQKSSLGDGKGFAYDLKLPYAGYRNYDDLTFEKRGYRGDYWYSMNDYYTPGQALYGHTTRGEQYVGGDGTGVSVGLPVRCIQNTPPVTLTFNASTNGGSTSASSVTQNRGTEITLSKTTYPASKDGYTFVGWNTSSSAHTALSSITLNADTTVYAIFKKNLTATFTIQDANAVTKEGGITSCTLWNLDELCSITAPTLNAKNGYSALGWNTNSGATGSSLNSNTSISISSNVTYYSITKSNDKILHITYTKGKGVEEIGKTSDSCTLTGTYNGAPQATSCTVTAPSITPKSGYENEIWTENGTNHTVQELETITLTEDLHLTASAEYEASSTAHAYNIVYNLNGEGIITGEKTTYTIEDTFTLVEPIRTGYEFIGWTGSNGDISQTGVVISVGTTGDLEFTANWTCAEGYVLANGLCVKQFTVTFNPNGGEVEGESSLTTDNEGKVILPGATREANENGERVFEGWFASTGVSEKIGNSGDIIIPTEDMEVYAHWAQTITIRDPANPLSGFTIMDRNLGAITTGTWVNTSTDSYGFHYQWGNNYGFDPNIDPSELPTSSVKVNVDGLTSYYSGVFIITNKSNENDKRHDTWMETNNNNLWNGDKIQGPCPEGWHIPSHDELNNLLIYWAKSNNVTWTTPDNSVKINSGHLKISNDLYIPYAGARNYDGSFLNRGNLGIFWSYSINGSSGLPYDFFTSNIDGTYVRNNDGRIRGLSVRCFRDEYVAPSTSGTTATLLPGSEFNVLVKNLSKNSTGEDIRSYNGEIEKIYRSYRLPEALVNTGLISTEDSQNEIIAWFDDSDDEGILYYYTQADTIYMNSDSSNMFEYFAGLKDTLGIRDWDTSNVTNMSSMFDECGSLEEIDLSKWNTNNVTDMNNMFYNCWRLEKVDLSNWNTNNVTDMSYMFSECGELKIIYASSGFIVKAGTNSHFMFGSYSEWTSYYAKDLVGGNGTKNYGDVTDGTYAKIDTQSQSGYFTDKKDITVRFMVGYDEFDVEEVKYGNKVTAPDTSTLEGFSGWYYEGEEFDFDSTNILKYTELYAKGVQSQDTILLPGEEFNILVKEFVNNSEGYDVWDNDNKIKRISHSDTAPGMFEDTITISVENSENEVIAWFDDGTLYYYTQAETIYMNPDSSYMFMEFGGLIDLSGINDWNASKVTNMGYMFYDCWNLEELDLNSWDVSNVVNMESMFSDCSSLVDISGIRNWNIMSVTNMSFMFAWCDELVDLSDISGWNTSKVVNMSYMFYVCNGLINVDLSNWNTSSLKDASDMFSYCKNLKNINLGNWNTKNLIRTYEMFYNLDSLKTLDLSNWDTSNLMNTESMFYDVPYLTTVYASGGFVINSKVESGWMFDSENLVGGNGTKFDWDFDDGTYAKIDNQSQSGYFTDKSQITVRFKIGTGIYTDQVIEYGETPTIPSDPDIGKDFIKWVGQDSIEYDFSSPIYEYTEVYAKFGGGTEAILLPGKQINVIIKNLAGQPSASYNTKNTTVKQIVKWTGNIPSGVTTRIISEPYSDIEVMARFTGGILYYSTQAETIYMNSDSSNLFREFTALTGVDIRDWNTSNVTDMSFMFDYCESLGAIDVSNFNTSNVTNMNNMFYRCFNIKSLDVSNFDTRNVTSMRSMFAESHLTSLDLSSFETYNLTDMYYMFGYSNNLAIVDMSRFDTSNVTNMNDMFRGSPKVKTIYASSGFVVNSGTKFDYMLPSSLIGGNGTKYNFSNNDRTYIRIDTQSQSGYFTDKNEITVRFILSGSIYTGLVTSYGSGVSKPADPEGYNIIWYYTGMQDEFDFDTNKITEYIELYGELNIAVCPTGEEYVGSKDKCLPSRSIIRDSVSGEIIQINDMEYSDLNVYFLSSTGNVTYNTIMDRNMGATEVYNQNYGSQNTASYGYYYQWGNNYGFPNSGEITKIFSGQVDASSYGPNKPYSSDTFITGNPDWSIEPNDNLRGGNGSEVDRQGPCPEGYHVPNSREWKNIYDYWNSANGVTSNKLRQWASDLLIPFAGYRNYSSAGVGYQGTYGFYWSSSRYNANRAYYLYFNSSALVPQGSGDRAHGFSVRCFKNFPSSTLTLHANGGTGAVIAFTGTVGDGKFTTLGTPTRSNSTFSGWYDAQGNKLGVGSGVVSDIYARWSCDSGYIDLGDGNGCVKSEATLLPGTGFNAVIKQLANPGNAYVSDYWFMDSNVTGLIRAQTLTTEYVTGIISTEDSIPVYVWYNNGVVYYYSDAEKIYLSEDSSHMFHSFKKLVDISGITNWDTSRVMNMERMFYDMESLVNVSNISGWDTSKVTDMNGMFYLCYDLKDISGIENWDTSKVTDMNGMFSNCDSLEMVDLTNRNVGNVTDMSYMFLGSEKLKIVNLSGWNATNLDSAEGMFKWCEDLEMADLSNWNAENLTTTEEMFEECYNLETLYLNGWNTRNLITTRYMFQECYRLKTLDLSSWNINNVTDMLGMFRKCYELETLDLSSWNTNNLVDMEDIFDECTSLKTIYASSGFVVNGDYYMFDTENLVGGNGTRFDWNFDDGTYAKIDNENQTGYFTDPSHFAIRFRNLSGDEIATQWISTGGTATGLVKNYASFSYYTDSGATTPYDFTKKLYAYSEVYADMTCDDGYTEVNGECVQQFTVEFEAYINGGLVNISGNLVASGSIKVASGTEINLSDYVAVNDPTSYIGDGWVFDGWGTIPERQFKITSPTLVITGDITLHALFYKIYESYFELQDINAGTLSSNTGYCTGYNGETSCDLIIPTFTENDGYIFDGFSNSQGSTGTIDIYTIGNTYYTVTHETTPISVTFNVNGNSGTTETRECYKYNGSDICLIKSPDITPAIGFTKIGWSTDAGTHTNEWNVNTLSGVSANSTYYAQSKKDKVTLNISYGTGVGVSSISKISDSCDLAEVWNGTSQATSCTVTAPDITLKSGYGTGVWTKDTNPSVIKNPGDDIELTSNDSYTASAIATVYPISYHENGGTLVGQKTSYTVEEDFTLVTPNRDSYVFEGWTGSNGDNPQKTVTVNSGTVTGPLNYYANWTPITYTIAFNGNAVNVEGTQSSMDATYDSGDTAPESNFTRPGYTFTSWNTQSDGNGINYDTGSELKNLTNTSGDVVTLYAIWQANTDTPYTVHYYLENIDDENYTFDSTDGKAGTTDDEISIDTLKKEITGAHFEKAAVVVSNQGPEYGATTTVDNITISGDGNTEVYLFYKRNTHTVTAIAGEGVGSVSGAGTYKYGQTVTLTPGNINSCYTANSKTFIMPDNDVQETLNGVIKKFTVTLNKDSHISSVQGNGEYNCGVEVNVSATPNVGYEFVRWEKNSTQVSAQSSYTFTITESVVLNAVSKAQNGITYTVRHWIRDVGANTYAKYSEESKSGETDSPITLENEKISVPCGTYAEGKENGTVKTTTIIKGDGSTVIDLYYSRNSYTVTISKDSGILSVSNSASHECGAGVTITATPKTGYSFNRYSSTDVDSSTNNPYTFTMPDKAVSIQAQSNANTYTVNFNANGGTGTMSQQTFTYDISQQLSDNLFTRTGYIFTGWSIDSGATVPTYTNKQSVDNLATTGSITLYAIWTTKGTSTKYTVRHIKQGLSTPTDDVVETQELYAETNSVQTPAVNTYSGFNSPSVGNITVSANGNASIDYVYTRKNITLTLDKDNGTQNSTITGKYGANVQKPTSNPQKTGYTFTGWSPNIPDTFPAISGTHVAQYTLDTYTITYNLNGGINHIDNPTTYTYLSGDITLKAPTRDGYVFSGWMGTDVNSVTKTVTISTHSEGNRSYTAVWGEDNNGDGQNDADETKYTVIYTDGVDNEVIFADQKTENILSGTITPPFNGSTGRVNYIFSGWNPIVADKVTKNATYTAQWKEDFNHNGIDDAAEPHYKLTIHYVNGSGGKVYDDYTGNYVSGASYSIISPLRTYYTIQTGGEVISGVMGAGNIEKTVVYLANHDTNGNGIADEEESITPTPAPIGGSSSSGGGGGGKKPTDGDSHGSASDKDSGDLNKTGENPIDTPEESKGGENLNEVSKGNSITDTGVGKTSDSSSQGQIINYLNGSYTKEQVDAYNFAKSNGITTMPTIQQAKMNTSLSRIQMAKMLSNFAINVMKQEPDPEKGIVKFNDVTNKMDKQYDNAVTKAYQLGIMGQNMKNNEFRPNDEVTRAEFASALSRLLYQTDEGKYKSTGNYYIPHITRLYQEGIINNTNPKLKEKRGYVMLMLMRTVQ